MECPYCQAGEPSVWDGVLSHYAHPGPNDKLKMCEHPWRERCRGCSAEGTAYPVLLCETCRQTAARDQLRAEVQRLSESGEASFELGYDQAIQEIRDHFAKVSNGYVVAVIEKIWKISFDRRRKIS